MRDKKQDLFQNYQRGKTLKKDTQPEMSKR